MPRQRCAAPVTPICLLPSALIRTLSYISVRVLTQCTLSVVHSMSFPFFFLITPFSALYLTKIFPVCYYIFFPVFSFLSVSFVHWMYYCCN